MQYSPKLKAAMEEIKAIIRKHDVAAFVVLHEPGFSEYFTEISPSYSCAKFEAGGSAIRIKAKVEEDFGGHVEAQQAALHHTSNMLHLLGLTGGKIAMNLFEVSEQFDKHTGARHDPEVHYPHTDQNTQS
jgi:hypothetical protein